MNPDAEQLFDAIGREYEDVYANNPGVDEVVDPALKGLSPGSKVLDVGCGTGKPVAHRVASGGHAVHDIDISQEMINICRGNIVGKFEKADMTTFESECRFDAIFFSIFSMFQLSHSQTYSMMFKYSNWLKPNGKLILGTIPSTSLVSDERLYDSTGQVVRHADLIFMGNTCTGTVYTQLGWHSLFQSAGFEIELERMFPFKSKPPYDAEAQEHYLIIAKKVVDHVLMGPYPLPSSYRGPHPLILDVIKGNREVLGVGSGYGRLPIAVAKNVGKCYSIEPNADRGSIQAEKAREQGVETRAGTAESIPFLDGQFDAVVAMWILHYVGPRKVPTGNGSSGRPHQPKQSHCYH